MRAKITLLLLPLTFWLLSVAQKPTIDSSVYGRWPSLGEVGISNDGKYSYYWTKTNSVGAQNLTISSTVTNWRKTIPNISSNFCALTQDSRKAIVKLPGDSLTIISLGQITVKYISHVKSFKLLSCGKNEWLIYQSSPPKDECTIVNLRTGHSFLEKRVCNYLFCQKKSGVLLETASDSVYSLEWLSLKSGQATNIWSGVNCNLKIAKFDHSGNELAFMTGNLNDNVHGYTIWEYKLGNKIASLLANDTSKGIKEGFTIAARDLFFSKDATHLYFDLESKEAPSTDYKLNRVVNIWNYKDTYLQSVQLSDGGNSNSTLTCSIAIGSHRILTLNQKDEKLTFLENVDNDKYVLCYKTPPPDDYYVKDHRPSLFLESIIDGSKTLIAAHFNFSGFHNEGPMLSPKEKFVLWFDSDSLIWYSYDIEIGAKTDISHLIPVEVYDTEAVKAGRNTAFGIGGWLSNDRNLLMYDQYDIWEVDPDGIKQAINITKSVGRKQRIVLSILNSKPYDLNNAIHFKKDFLLTGFNRVTKESGFWSLDKELNTVPKKLVMECLANWIEREGITTIGGIATTQRPVKALQADVYLTTKMSASHSPNVFITRDFRSFRQLSRIEPEKKYNWIRAQLITWNSTPNQISQGVLYKPENFDSTKRYPVIFDYYEKRSDELNKYIAPDYSRDRINIPTYVSNGYLVFVPDIYYRSGKNGVGVLNSVVSAAKYLSSFPWVDSGRLGLQGHSFAGWETNFLITHTHLFAAACEAAGASDLVSAYDELQFATGLDRQKQYELDGQGSAFGIGVTPWTAPSSYIENSPIFYVDSITTPLLMMQSRPDTHMPFEQAVELFMGMKRAGKKVWLLDYPAGGHSLWNDEARDFTARMQQFFDHYLKGTVAPIWMTRGIPASSKGADSGLELDKIGSEP